MGPQSPPEPGLFRRVLAAGARRALHRGSGSEPAEQFGLLRGELLVGEDAALMQPG
jgi:hypothetical protein